jgi:ribosome-associated heat shock protein Hsp15
MSQVRLDVWLDVACLFRTRSEAQKACKGGKVEVNGQTAKPHREIRIGDGIRITRPAGRRQIIVVRGLAERHVSRTLARELYTDTTPPLSAEEIGLRRLERVFRASAQAHPGRSPNKRERRALRHLRGH